MKLLILLLFFSLSLFAQHSTFIKADGSVMTYSVKKEETKLFAINLSNDKTYSIHAEQKGIDVALTLTTLRASQFCPGAQILPFLDRRV